MKDPDVRNKILAASKLLTEETTSFEKLKAAAALLRGINPKIDRVLDKSFSAISKIEGLKKGDIIILSETVLADETEEEKKQKKKIIFFLKTLKELREEVERVKNEIQNQNIQRTNLEKSRGLGRLILHAKGPLGIVTAGALIIVVAGFIFFPKDQERSDASKTSPANSGVNKIKVIEFANEKIPLTELKIVTGPECDRQPHYHALNGISAKTVTQTIINDPRHCGYGKTSEVMVREVIP